MKIGFIIYGSLDVISGGYLFDRMLVSYLRKGGDVVEITGLAPRSYGAHLLDNVDFRLAAGFDVILQDELNHPSLILANARKHPSPVISIVHNLRSSERRSNWENAIYRRLERRYLDSVDGFIFNSKATRSSVEGLIAARKPHVIASPGGDRLGNSTPRHVRTRSLQRGPLRLLFLGHVTAGKGLEVVLDALALLPHGAYALDVVGSYDIEQLYAQRMRRKAADLKLPVCFRGALDEEPLIERLSQAQVLVLPSFYEGFGIAYLEGMAHGLPAIGTTAGAIPELIVDGTNGFLINPGDFQTLAWRLHDLGVDRALLSRLGVAALQTYRSRPSWAQTAEVVRRFLVRMCSERESTGT